MGGLIGSVFGSGNGANYEAKVATLPTQDTLVGDIQEQQRKAAEAQDMLAKQAAGLGPDPAAAQLQAATNANNQNAYSLISSQKGVNPALAARLAAQQAGTNNQMAANQATQLRAQQQLQGQQQLAANNLGEQQILQGALANQNQSQVANYGQYNGANAGVAKQNAATQGGIVGGLGAAATSLAMAPGKAAGGVLTAGGDGGGTMFAAHGGRVPGTAEVSGDSPRNDTVSAKLSPGEIVVPRTAAKDPDKAKEFIDHVMKSKKSDEPKGYSKVLAKHKKLEERIKALEKKAS